MFPGRAAREDGLLRPHQGLRSSHFGPPTLPKSTASERLASDRFLADRGPINVNRRPADKVLRQVEAVVRDRLNSAQHLNRLGHHLPLDAVTRQDRQTKGCHLVVDVADCVEDAVGGAAAFLGQTLRSSSVTSLSWSARLSKPGEGVVQLFS